MKSLLIILFALSLPLSQLDMAPATAEWPLFWQLRSFLVTYSGIVTMLLMSFGLILSVKHWPIERWIGGLDKQYRLHKHLGIAAVTSALFHWLSFLSDDIAMSLGLIPQREETYPFWKLVDALGDPAQLIGEWGFYIAAALVLIAWIRHFPHHVFQQTHRLFPYLYLVLVLHLLQFFDAEFWLSPMGLVLGTAVVLAVMACLITIKDRNGRNKRCQALIESIRRTPDGLDLCLRPANPSAESLMMRYQPGQFVFADFGDKERPHPFSLAATLSDKGNIRLLIKACGDYTSGLSERLSIGQGLVLEGPYGCFTLLEGDDEKSASTKQQLWVAGGIGITPFLSALDCIQAGENVELFYSFQQQDTQLIEQIKEKARRAKITLHLIDTSRMPRIQVEDVINRIQDRAHCQVWYCGPRKLGEALRKALREAGLPGSAFHQECFQFR